MTALKRSLLILAAALLVVGAALAWNQLSPLAGGDGERQPPAGFTRPTSGDHAAGGWSAAGEIAKNMVIVGALTAAVAGGSRLWTLVRPRGRRAPPVSA